MTVPPARTQMERYLLEIREGLVAEFGISTVEAEGRMNRAFAAWDLTTEESELMIGHEEVEYWVSWVYFGPDAWWDDETDHQPRSWP